MARRGLRNLDWVLVLAAAALIAVGTVLVYSASRVPMNPGQEGIFSRQLTWLGLGVVVMFFTAAIPFRLWEEFSHFFYVVGVALLLAVFVVGVNRLGAQRWISLGGFQFQPSEPAKLATLLLVARLLAQPRFDYRRISHVAPAILAALVTFVLILLEPDLGTSLSVPAALAPMLYWAGLPLTVLLILGSPVLSAILAWNLWVWLVFLGILAAFLWGIRLKRQMMVAILALNMAVGAATPLLWNALHPYQRERILTVINPERDRLGSGYQVIQSKIAIGSGGFLGKGFLEGTQKGLGFLPERHTDFIFSVLGEEFGFVGCAGVLLLYALFIQRGVVLATRARSRFAGILTIGICGMILFHVAVNVSMTLGLVPVTGLPLPFLSYGGTFLLITLAQVGLLLNVALRRNEV